MPPKKKVVEEEKSVIMGRMGSTNLRCGIVGLPNVGWDLGKQTHTQLGPLLLTWINFNPSMDK